MRARRVDCLRCKEFRAHHSRGLCRSCVTAVKEAGDLEYYPQLPKGRPPKTVEDQTGDEVSFPGRWVRRGLVYYAEEVAS